MSLRHGPGDARAESVSRENDSRFAVTPARWGWTRSVRFALAAAGLAGVLALSACVGGSGSEPATGEALSTAASMPRSDTIQEAAASATPESLNSLADPTASPTWGGDPTATPRTPEAAAAPIPTTGLPLQLGSVTVPGAAVSTPIPTLATATPPATAQPAPSPTPTAPPAPTARPAIQKPLTTRSWLERAEQFQAGQLTNTRVVPGEGVRLSDSSGDFAAAGEYLSPVQEAPFPFNDAVLSWNADAPAGTSLRFELRVRAGEGWSGWYAMGEWRPEGGRSISGQSDAQGRVDIDTLKLKTQATALQYRVKLTTSSPSSSPLLRQVSVAYADLRVPLSGPAIPRPEGGARDLDVPRHSQLAQDPSIALKICSPTSVAMVLQYWGVNKSVLEVVSGVRDRTTGIYGNWPLNTAYAAANGFDARIERFYSLEQLEQEIAAGRPVVISVAFGAGELANSPTNSTDGHLIVVRGFTPEGDVIVNDPVAPNSSSVRRVYKKEQLGRIWLRSGGIAYLISPRSGVPRTG